MRRGAFLAAVTAAATAPAFGEPARAARPAVALGDDVFVRDAWRALRGRTIGIVTNPTGTLSTGESLIDAVHRNGAIAVKALFGPEHGIRGTVGAGETVGSSVDEKTGLPVHSLYGAARRPTAAMLDGIDVLVFDIQDVGARPYTYFSTLAYVMEAAAQYGKSVWVLDRPNPIGGVALDGPVLDPKFKSFIGLYPIPERHGLTIGEFAKLANERFGIGCSLHVVPMEGWSREMLWSDTGLTWIPTSPNIPYARTTMVYLATGLIDEAGVNNGIGTDRPFEYAGGFGFDAAAFRDTLAARAIPGVEFEPTDWTPARGFWANKTLHGVAINVTDPHAFPNVRTAVELLVAARAQGKLAIAHAASMDRDWGTDAVRTSLLAGAPADAIVAAWKPGLTAYRALRAGALLYAR
ncbi:hypothetical protein WPS_09430 [Vulcanimicrobium alpinum]|uniref:DUF1343 domain-containing protein n=1 Tax=Vulcanimicrobium alpinum TaxID=3016050 RepID=A0AAN2C9J2_UNVUL|nr:DUF1343 domain-containing protein [Vulcanimicrobium alpinum]BDE05667.1 hypothetical protein WPS_09430 [Vulcanimicrobium alpinum]